MKKKKGKKLLILAIILSILIIYIIIGFSQTSLKVTTYEYTSAKIPTEFDGYSIALLTDLHNKNFGENQSELLEKVKAARPDIIALGGDIIDEDHEDLTSAKVLIEGLVQIAPVYYVTGNHEQCKEAADEYKQFRRILDEYGVININDSSVILAKGEASITLTGCEYHGNRTIESRLPIADSDTFNILLYHANTTFDKIYNYGYDIILAGHGHGGLVRLPFIGGLFENGGGLFPKYDCGSYTKGNSTLIVSRGLGDGCVPRFYNPPELVIVNLYSNSQTNN